MPPLQTSLSSFFHKAAEKVTAFKALGEVTAEPGERPPPTPATGSADNAVTFQGGGSHEAHRHVIGLWDGYARAVFGPQPDGPKPPAVGEAFWAVYVAECPGSPDEYACCAGRVLSNPSQRWGDLFEFQYDGPDGGPPIWVPRHWLFRGQQRAEAVVRGLNAKLERQRREAAERRRPAKSVTAKHPPAQRERRRPRSPDVAPPARDHPAKRLRPASSRSPSPPGHPRHLPPDRPPSAAEAAPAPDAPGALAPVDAAEEKAQGDGPPPSVGTGEDTAEAYDRHEDEAVHHGSQHPQPPQQPQQPQQPHNPQQPAPAGPKELKEDAIFDTPSTVDSLVSSPNTTREAGRCPTAQTEPPPLESSPAKGPVSVPGPGLCSPPQGLVVGLKLWFLSGAAGGPVLVGQPRVPDMAVAAFFSAAVLGCMEEFEAMRPPQGQVLYAFRVDKDGGKRPLTARAAVRVPLADCAGFILAAQPVAGALWAEVATDGRLVRHADLP